MVFRPTKKSIFDDKINIAIIIFFVFRFIYTLFVGVHPDELYYWDMGQTFALGYDSQAPLLFWITKIGTTLLGDSLFAFKIAVFIPFLLSFLTLNQLLRRYVPSSVISLVLLALFFGAPALSVAGLFLTPLVLLLFCWSVALLLGYVLLFEDDSSFTWGFLGVIIGLGLLSDYSFLLFPLSFFLTILFIAPKKIFSGKFLITFLFATLLFAPHIIWSMHHNWIGFQTYFLIEKSHINLNTLLSHIMAISPFTLFLLFVALITLFLKEWEDKKVRYLVCLTAIPLFLSVALSFLGIGRSAVVGFNEITLSFIAGLLLCSCLFATSKEGSKVYRYFFLTTPLTIIFALVFAVHTIIPFLPLSFSIDGTQKRHGWKKWGKVISEVSRSLEGEEKLPLAVVNDEECALARFYIKTRSIHPFSTILESATINSLYNDKFLIVEDIGEPRITVKRQAQFEEIKLVALLGQKKVKPDALYGVMVGNLRKEFLLRSKKKKN